MVKLESMWYEYLREINCFGQYQEKDDAKIMEIVGVHKYIRRPQDFYGNMRINEVDKFLNLLKQGAYDIKGYSLMGSALYEYVTAWQKKEMILLNQDLDFIYTYPERVFNYKTYDKSLDAPASINQYEVMLARLKENIFSNRAVATLYNCGLDKNEEHIPCLNFLQALVRNNELTLVCMFRSNDIFNAWPSNMYLLTHLGMMLASDCGVVFDGIDYHCSSAHYYMTEEPLVEQILDEGFK